ncbi:MAG TPA: hypothetical protein VHL11_06200, partial [Phototrophicaceae bacterium]|nr:hypothetical protein [Phototrophicaceae bacterium]
MGNRFRILIASLVTLLLLSILSAAAFPVNAAVNFTLTPGKNVYSIIMGNSSSKQLSINNTSGSPLQITSVTLGGNAPGSYSITGLPATPFNIPTGNSQNFNVQFSNGTAGVYLASVTVSAGIDTATAELRGLATKGTGGNNEPSLAWIMTTFFGNINTGLSNLDPGDDDPSTTTIHSVYGGYAPLIGDEVAAPTFVRANTGAPVTLDVIAAFGNNATPAVRWGYYQPGNTGNRTEIFTVNNSPASNVQTLNPATSGSLSFTPSLEPFGLYTIWPPFANREVYSEDQFNTWETQAALRHKFRAFPIPGEANAYLVTWEEFTSGFDYNDVVVIMHNVQPASGIASMLRLENLDWQKLIAFNSSNTDWLNSYLVFNGIRDHLLDEDPFYKQHREVTLRIHNRSAVNTLNINSISFD